MKVTRIIAVSMMLFFGLFAAVAAYSQVTGATLGGTVTDPSGAAVPGAQISVKNNATGVTREVTSDSSGLYTVPNVIPGDYEIRVSAKGFSTARQSNVSLAVGQQQQLNFSLKVGETSQTVEVTGAAPQIELTSSALTGQVESETVRELPLNGRDWTSLATLQPGVNKIETQVSYSDAGRGARGFGSELTISGQRSTFNNYRIDGVTVVDYANAAPGNVIGVVLAALVRSRRAISAQGDALGREKPSGAPAPSLGRHAFPNPPADRALRTAGAGDAADSRRQNRHDFSGADDVAQPRLHDRRSDRRGGHAPPAREHEAGV